MFVDAGIAEIDIWPEHNDVNKAKEKLASGNDYNKYFSTSSMGLATNLEPVEGPDLAHYDSISMIKLGQKFASYIE